MLAIWSLLNLHSRGASVTNALFVAIVIVATTVGAWMTWGRSAWRGMRTGKMIVRNIRADVSYDRTENPYGYWNVLISPNHIGAPADGNSHWHDLGCSQITPAALKAENVLWSLLTEEHWRTE
jgi:hypothetical protein